MLHKKDAIGWQVNWLFSKTKIVIHSLCQSPLNIKPNRALTSVPGATQGRGERGGGGNEDCRGGGGGDLHGP